MSEKPKQDKEPFLKYVNGPTKKDPRKSNSHDHNKAVQQIKDQQTQPKKKIQKDFKF